MFRITEATQSYAWGSDSALQRIFDRADTGAAMGRGQGQDQRAAPMILVGAFGQTGGQRRGIAGGAGAEAGGGQFRHRPIHPSAQCG